MKGSKQNAYRCQGMVVVIQVVRDRGLCGRAPVRRRGPGQRFECGVCLVPRRIEVAAIKRDERTRGFLDRVRLIRQRLTASVSAVPADESLRVGGPGQVELSVGRELIEVQAAPSFCRKVVKTEDTFGRKAARGDVFQAAGV